MAKEVFPGLILGGLNDLDDMLRMRPDALVPLDRLPGRVWQTGFRGEILYCPITDRQVLPDDVLDRLVGQIVSRIRGGKRLAVFCLGGHGRTGYVAACALFALGVAEPMPFLWKNYSASAVETDLQVAAVLRFCDRFTLGDGSSVTVPQCKHEIISRYRQSTTGKEADRHEQELSGGADGRVRGSRGREPDRRDGRGGL